MVTGMMPALSLVSKHPLKTIFYREISSQLNAIGLCRWFFVGKNKVVITWIMSNI